MRAVYLIRYHLKLSAFPVLITLITSSLSGCSLISELTLRMFPPPSGTILLSEYFSSVSQEWQNPERFVYLDGGYLISLERDHLMTWAGPKKKFGLVHLEVDARSYSTDENNFFGFVCGAVDQDDYYFLIISSDGYYGIGEVRDGNSYLIGMEAMLPSDVILGGENWNHLGADCLATRLSLIVNGTQIGEVNGIQYRPGRAGLVVGSLGSGFSQILFDNFRVQAP